MNKNLLELYHFTNNSNWKIDRSIMYDQTKNFKPYGLWLSDENIDNGESGWYKWCIDNQFMLNDLKYKYKVILNIEKICVISNMTKLLDFDKQYKQKDDEIIFPKINWKDVSNNYNGILISPYTYRKKELMWHSLWDCSSGCVWNLSSIVNVEKC